MNRLTYDGFGINDSDEYATRLCTFAKGVPESRKKELGALLAHAPQLLAACQAAASYFLRSRQSHAPECEVLLNAIARARGKGIRS